MRVEAPYCRLQVRYNGRLGVPVGIFVAVDHLRRADRLSDADESTYFDIDDWFRAELPEPPFYQDGNSVGAVTWFKTAAAGDMLGRLEPLREMLRRYEVPHDLAESADPGRIVYADDFQVGVIPYHRAAQTPLPAGTTLGPTTPGSKRHLARCAESEKPGSTPMAYGSLVPERRDDDGTNSGVRRDRGLV